MEKACADKVVVIKHDIKKRRQLLKQLNPGLSDLTVLHRSLGWAKRQIESHNRFQPEENRQQVTLGAWELLMATPEYQLDTAQLRTVDVYYDRYKNKHPGYDLSIDKDGRV